jgi:O-antigen/teichoic acid export membrane protein
MRLGVRVFWTFATRIALAAVGLLSGAILARSLGPDGKGSYELVVLASALAVSWGGLGVDLAVAYSAARGMLAEEELKATTLWLGAVWGVVVGLLVLFALRLVADSLMRDVEPSLLLLAAGLVPVLMVVHWQRTYLLGRNRVLAYNGASLFVACSTGLLLVVFVIALGTGLHGAVWAYAVAHLLALAIVLRLNRTPLARFPDAKIVAIARELVTFGGKAQLGNTLQHLSYRADMFIVNLFLGTASVGYYSVAVALAEAVWYVPRTVALVFLPHIAASTHQEAERITPVICRQTGLLSLLAALALAVAGPLVIVVFFTEQFLPAVLPLWLLLPGIVVSSLARPLASYQLGRGRPLISLYVAVLSTPLSLVAYLLLIPSFGIAGAAVASSFSYVVMAVLEISFLLRMSSIRLTELLVPQPADWMLYRSFLARARESITRAER